jgi:hypothetical protein
MQMSQATAAGARMCQGTYITLQIFDKGKAMWYYIKYTTNNEVHIIFIDLVCSHTNGSPKYN